MKAIEPRKKSLQENLEKIENDFNVSNAEWKRKLAEVEARANSAKAELETFPALLDLFTDFEPEVITAVLTDADGTFEFRDLPRSSYGVFARASRQVNNSQENYGWLISVDLRDTRPERILLSNHNLATSSSSENVFLLPAR
jgi:hypothetical protein